MVALLMPFKPSSLEIDDAAFVKYLDVSACCYTFKCIDLKQVIVLQQAKPNLLLTCSIFGLEASGK